MTGGEAALYADAAYSAAETRRRLAARGVADQVQRKGYRNHPLPEAEVVRNKEIAVTRSGVEHIFGHGKQVWGLARTRFLGWRATGPSSRWSPSRGTSRRARPSFASTGSAPPDPALATGDRLPGPATRAFTSARAPGNNMQKPPKPRVSQRPLQQNPPTVYKGAKDRSATRRYHGQGQPGDSASQRSSSMRRSTLRYKRARDVALWPAVATRVVAVGRVAS